MTATRTLEDAVSNPGGFSGTDYTTKARAEIEGLWTGIVNEVRSIGGSANAITGSCLVPLIGSYVDGMTFRFTPTAGNTGVATINIDGKGTVALVQPNGNPLAAGHLISGCSVDCFYDAPAGNMRLSAFPINEVASFTIAQFGAAQQWLTIGDTTIGAAVANVEHSFIANTYIKILAFFSDITPTGSTPVNVTLRNSGGAIVTVSSTNITSLVTGEARFICGVVASTKQYLGTMDFADSVAGAAAATPASGGNASAADRVRYAFSSGNITSGRLITKGLTV